MPAHRLKRCPGLAQPCLLAAAAILALAGPAPAETALTKSTVVQYEPYNRFGTCFSALTLLNELPQVVSISLDSLFLDRDGAVIGDPSFRFRNVAPGRVVAEDQPFRNLPCNRIAQIRYRVARCEVDGQRAEIAFCEAQLSFENRAVIEVTLDGLEAAQTP